MSRPEGSQGCHSSGLSTMFFATGFLTETWGLLIKEAGWGLPMAVSLLCALSGWRGSESDFHAFSANALLTGGHLPSAPPPPPPR